MTSKNWSFWNFLVYAFYRGQNPLHVLGTYGKDNAAAIFELFVKSMPEYPIAKVDAEGNTGEWAQILWLW